VYDETLNTSRGLRWANSTAKLMLRMHNSYPVQTSYIDDLSVIVQDPSEGIKTIMHDTFDDASRWTAHTGCIGDDDFIADGMMRGTSDWGGYTRAAGDVYEVGEQGQLNVSFNVFKSSTMTSFGIQSWVDSYEDTRQGRCGRPCCLYWWETDWCPVKCDVWIYMCDMTLTNGKFIPMCHVGYVDYTVGDKVYFSSMSQLSATSQLKKADESTAKAISDGWHNVQYIISQAPPSPPSALASFSTVAMTGDLSAFYDGAVALGTKAVAYTRSHVSST